MNMILYLMWHIFSECILTHFYYPFIIEVFRGPEEMNAMDRILRTNGSKYCISCLVWGWSLQGRRYTVFGVGVDREGDILCLGLWSKVVHYIGNKVPRPIVLWSKVVHYIGNRVPRPIGLWSKVVHYVGNKVSFWDTFQVFVRGTVTWFYYSTCHSGNMVIMSL